MLGGNDLGTTRHGFGPEFRHQATKVGIARQYYILGPDFPLFGFDDCRFPRKNLCNGRVLVNHAAAGFQCRHLAQSQVKRVDMATGMVDRTPNISLRANALANGSPIEQLKLFVAESLPQRLLALQMLQLLRIERSKNTALFQVAVNAVTLHPLADNLAAFEGHFGQELQVVLRSLPFDAVQIAAEAVHDLPAIAPRSTPANRCRFQNHHSETGFCQEQRRRQAGITGTNDAHIRLAGSSQSRTHRGRIGGRCVIRGNRRVLDHYVAPGRWRRSWGTSGYGARRGKSMPAPCIREDTFFYLYR